MSRQVDYEHLHNEVMGAVHLVANSNDEELAKRFGDLIDFLETMYVNSILSLVGSLLAVSKHETDPEVAEEGLKAARELLEAPKANMPLKLQECYEDLITRLNLPDAYQLKTHNEEVVEQVLKEEAEET